MDKELSTYITTYFSHLFTSKEQLGMKHLMAEFKLKNSKNRDGKIQIYKKIGWYTEDRDILELVNGGQDKLEEMIAERLLKEHPDKVFINNCPNCGKLARTPVAKQCRHCGKNWR